MSGDSSKDEHSQPTSDGQEVANKIIAVPNSIAAWRACKGNSERHEIWMPFSAALKNAGITLFDWIPYWMPLYCVPPDRQPRARKEPGVYTLVVDDEPEVFIQQVSPLIHPARDETGRWVLLRVVRIGSDGDHHLDVLRFLSEYPQRGDARNHCLPILREVEEDRVTIAVLPLLSMNGFENPWFTCLSEALEFIIQATEGVAYLHSRLIVHRDIAIDNVVCNVLGPFVTQEECSRNATPPWRTRFPIRYYLIDLELARRFPMDSSPESRLVQGTPIPRFGRESAPEVYGDEPYDPFAADIFALGLMFWHLFRKASTPGFMPLVERLLVLPPRERPVAADALRLFHTYREGLSATALYDEPIERVPGEETEITHPTSIMPTSSVN